VTKKEEEALRLVREAATEAAAAGGLPAFLGELERVRVEAVVQAFQQPVPAVAAARQPSTAPRSRVLTPDEAAVRVGRSKWWVYRNKAALPVVRFPSGGWGVSEEGLERWIERRTS